MVIFNSKLLNYQRVSEESNMKTAKTLQVIFP